MSFLDDIKAFEQKALLAANRSVNRVTEELFTSIVVESPSPSNPGPYAEGLLANQYYPEVGGGFSSTITTATNPNGMDSLSRIKAMIAANPFMGKDNIVTLTTNVPYAYNAEVLGWQAPTWSGKQGPYAMMSKSVAKVRGMYL